MPEQEVVLEVNSLACSQTDMMCQEMSIHVELCIIIRLKILNAVCVPYFAITAKHVCERAGESLPSLRFHIVYCWVVVCMFAGCICGFRALDSF